MNKELTKEEAEEFYNKLWLENKELIQENIGKINTERFELELELVDKNKEIERLHSIIKEVRENIDKKLNINSDYVDYDFGTELLRQELLEILEKEK